MEIDKREQYNIFQQLRIKHIWWLKSKKPSATTVTSWIMAFASFVAAVATVTLVILTNRYLNETKETRKLYEKIVSVETTPKVFVNDVQGMLKTSDVNVPIVMYYVISNCGKVEAKDVKYRHGIFHEKDNKKIPNDGTHIWSKLKGDVFPGQEIPIKIKPAFRLIEQINRNPISYKINIELEYKDTLGKSKKYNTEYRYEKEEWVINSEKEEFNTIKNIFLDPNMYEPMMIIDSVSGSASPTTVPFNLNR
ncbi:MAG: hypothetical protein GY845_29550 [Planctomycetes bacterium]|nr:hypothetical protein [Planctomycetota bacterium]